AVLPVSALQRSSRSGAHELQRRVARALEDLVQLRRERLGLVACDVLGDRLAVERAAGFAEPPREALGLVEYVVRQRNRSLHTRSITTPATAHGVLLAHSAGPARSPSILLRRMTGRATIAIRNAPVLATTS